MSKPPIALSDEALNSLLRLAQPLSPDDRETFLQLVAAQLPAAAGDGQVFRIARELQRQFLGSPAAESDRLSSEIRAVTLLAACSRRALA